MITEIERIATLEAQVTRLVKEVEELRLDRKNLLIRGVLSLGAVAVMLGSYIWSIKIG